MTQPTQGSILIPQNVEAERRVVGTLLISPESVTDVMDKLTNKDFYFKPYGYIYDAICSLSIDNKPVTIDTVSNVLSSRRILGSSDSALEFIGGGQALVATIESVIIGELDYWTDEVKKKTSERELYEFSKEVERIALSNPEDIDRARSQLEERLVALTGVRSTTTVGIETASSELDGILEKYFNDPESITGFATGWQKFDECLDGFRPGNVTIVYAKSSRYKSQFVSNLGLNLAKGGVGGLWFTTEMPRVQVMERLLQIESELNIKWLRRDKKLFQFRDDIIRAKQRLAKYPIYFCDTSSLNVSSIRADVGRYQRWHGIGYIIVDLVDHVHSSQYKDEMVNNQRAVMSSMKALAKDLNVHVILVSHVAKDRSGNDSPDLDVEEMIGSAAKYQDVDVAMSVSPYRLNMDNQMAALSREEILGRIADTGELDMLISVTKNRHGELLRYKMKMDWNRGGLFYPAPEYVQPFFNRFS